jgi:hypothetical protein
MIVEINIQARDPFYLPSEIKIESDPQKIEAKNLKMCYNVSGIMKIGDNYSALIKYGDGTRIVRKGDVLGCYRISRVDQLTVVAKKNNGEEEVWSISDR